MATETAGRLEAQASEYVAAWNEHDPSKIASFLAPGGVYEDTGAGVTVRGPDALREHAAAILSAFPDLRFELVRVATGDGFVAAEWRARMTHRGNFSGLQPSGRRLHSAGVDVATLDREGKVTHLVSHYDGAAILRQLGILPARGSRAERLTARLVSRWTRLRS
jgi:steroid delta-isomerase-like uncharacterized protein